MKTKHYLTAADVDILVDAALDYATAHSFNVSIAVVDDSGTLLMMKRMMAHQSYQHRFAKKKLILLRSVAERPRHPKI